MATDKIANLELEAKQGRGKSHAVSSVRLDPPSTVASRRKKQSVAHPLMALYFWISFCISLQFALIEKMSIWFLFSGLNLLCFLDVFVPLLVRDERLPESVSSWLRERLWESNVDNPLRFPDIRVLWRRGFVLCTVLVSVPFAPWIMQHGRTTTSCVVEILKDVLIATGYLEAPLESWKVRIRRQCVSILDHTTI
jgi:hypothetical protein